MIFIEMGWKIYTSIDIDMQHHAEETMLKQHETVQANFCVNGGVKTLNLKIRTKISLPSAMLP